MSEDFECDFSEGSLNEKTTLTKKKFADKEKNRTMLKTNHLKLSQYKEDLNKFKQSKLSKKNLKYFLIYYDGLQCGSFVKKCINDRRIEIICDTDIDFSKNAYFMLIDYKKEIVEGIFKKDYLKNFVEDISKKKVYRLKIEIKSRQEITFDELVSKYFISREYLKKFFNFENKSKSNETFEIGRGLSMVELIEDEDVDNFEAIRNSMIKKEEAQRKISTKFKERKSKRKRNRSSSSSSSDYSSEERKSSKKNKQTLHHPNQNYDMNFLKLQYESYLKNAAVLLSSQNIGNMSSMNNNLTNQQNISPTNFTQGTNPLFNQIYTNQYHTMNHLNQVANNTDKKYNQNNPPNFNFVPNMFPIFNPYIHMFPFNPNFPQPFVPLGIDYSEDQKKQIERININNYNFSKIN